MSEAIIHAGCVAIGGRGVLIVGEPGSGKSDLALRLLDRGAELVSDDYTTIRLEEDRLIASPPANISGRMEVRGVGIIERPFRASAPVLLLIDLDAVPDRLPEPGRRELLGVGIPEIGLRGLEPSAPLKVEAALLLHGLPLPCPP